MFSIKNFEVATNESIAEQGSFVPGNTLSDQTKFLSSDGSWKYLKFPGKANLSKRNISINQDKLQDVIYFTDATGPVSVSVSNSVIVATVSGNKIVCTCPSQRATECTLTITIGETNNYQEKVYEIHCESKFLMIYGVKWNKSYGNSKWIRTDNSADFEDPNPYYAGMDTTPSSPFDDLAPWKDLVDVERPGGTFVKIPKFYYKLNKDAEGTITLQIIEGAFATEALALGFKISPAHMDRGDGAGEKEVVYVSKYIASPVGGVAKSVPNYQVFNTQYYYFEALVNAGYTMIESTNGKPKGYSTTNAHIFDYTALATIQFLWLVEFADWNVNTCVGSAYVYNYPSDYYLASKTGYSTVYDYHTGTTTSRSNPGLTWYRNIEGILGTYVTTMYGYGIHFLYKAYDGLYIQTKVTYKLDDFTFSSGVFIDSQYRFSTSSSDSFSAYITDFDISTVPGYEWCLYPCAYGTNNTSLVQVLSYASYSDSGKIYIGYNLKARNANPQYYITATSSLFYCGNIDNSYYSNASMYNPERGYGANIRLMEL